VPAAAIRAALLDGPSALALIERTRGGLVVAVSRALAKALGLSAGACVGQPLRELLPPQADMPELPAGGGAAAYPARIAGRSARVELCALPDGRYLVASLAAGAPGELNGAPSEALLALSRDLSTAQREEDLAAAVVRALDALFPGRSYCIRLLDPRQLSLTSMRAKGHLAPAMRRRLALRRSAVLRSGLSEAQLLAGGAAVLERDEPVFVDGVRATAVPLTVGGSLHGVINLEYGRHSPSSPEVDEPLLMQVAHQAALGARNLRTLEELTHLKTFLEDLIENANALIAVVNRDREILVFNRAMALLTGFPREEALSEDLLDLVSDGERRRVEGVLERTLAGDAVSNFETRLRMRSGGEVRVAVNTSAIYGASGEVEGVIAIGQDTTLLRALQERAEHAQKLAELGKLAAGVVHELANPLTAVAAYSENLFTKFSFSGADPGDLEKLKRIREATVRLQRLSRDLMAYARPPTEHREEVDVRVLLEEAARFCEPALAKAGARLEKRMEPVPPVWGQKGSLLQVFVNLITNAAQALPGEGGEVTLELAPAGRQVSVRVRDSGAGMPEEVRQRIFEPFFTTKRDGAGTGLGLPIVQGIVSRHGGAVAVESEPGKGTTFTVLLPTELPPP
jgi:PAS domain S-box-containing protein